MSSIASLFLTSPVPDPRKPLHSQPKIDWRDEFTAGVQITHRGHDVAIVGAHGEVRVPIANVSAWLPEPPSPAAPVAKPKRSKAVADGL